jgi:GTPase SAR1 family protein
MKVGIDMGTAPDGNGAKLDIEELLATRLLVQGNSGSGKSHLLRRLLEQSAPWVQQCVIDPWALADFGIRCVISTSFADIFYNNCFKNGILPLVVSAEQLKLLLDDADRGANATLTVDLEAQTIKGPDGGTLHFDIDPSRKQILLEGLDDIAGTLKSDPAITGFEGKMAQSRPWL